MKVYGIVPGKVVDVKDPAAMGRVNVKFPILTGSDQAYWAPVATMMAGGSRGSWFMPEVDDDVLVAFQDGDVAHPHIVGFLWNGQQQPPRTDPHLRVLQSVNGHMIEMYDPPPGGADAGYIRIMDAYGNTIVLQDSNIAITGVGAITIDAPSILISGRPVSPIGGPI
jgi:uncharacterized protein involved in type VI secretion and phage assembly